MLTKNLTLYNLKFWMEMMTSSWQVIIVTKTFRIGDITAAKYSITIIWLSYDLDKLCRMNFPIIGMFFHTIDSSLYVFWNASILMRRWTTVDYASDPISSSGTVFLNSEIFNNFQQKYIFRFLNESFGLFSEILSRRNWTLIPV